MALADKLSVGLGGDVAGEQNFRCHRDHDAGRCGLEWPTGMGSKYAQ